MGWGTLFLKVLSGLAWQGGSDMKKNLLSDLSTNQIVCEGVPVTAGEKLSQLRGTFKFYI